MNLLFTICGRAGSKGIKNKNIKNFLDKPLALYSLSVIDLYLKKSNYQADIVLNTDSKDLMDIFENKLYDRYPSEVNELYDMGFLVSDGTDELRYLESLRIKTLEANNSSPSYYIICPTTGCNARCYYCFEKGTVQRKMDYKTAQAVAEYILKHHDTDNLVIQWFGGEPLLEPDTITFIVNYLQEHQVHFDSKIITNGFLLNDDIIHLALNKWNVKIIQITIDDLEEEYNQIKDYVYSNVNAFEIVMSNIGKCLKAGINTSFNSIIKCRRGVLQFWKL